MLLILTLSFFSIYGQDGLIPEKFIIHRVKKGENIIELSCKACGTQGLLTRVF